MTKESTPEQSKDKNIERRVTLLDRETMIAKLSVIDRRGGPRSIKGIEADFPGLLENAGRMLSGHELVILLENSLRKFQSQHTDFFKDLTEEDFRKRMTLAVDALTREPSFAAAVKRIFSKKPIDVTPIPDRHVLP